MNQLVLFETGGNQSYIFSANKLTDSVGASQLIEESGSDVVLDAIDDVVRAIAPHDVPRLAGPARADTRTNLADAEKNRRLIGPTPDPRAHIEVIFATSGTALLLARDKELAKALVSSVTSRLLDHAPGLEMTGAFVPFDSASATFSTTLTRVHEALNAAKSARAQAVRRFPRLPFVAPCRHTGLPAHSMQQVGDAVRLSIESIKKREAAGRWSRRIDDVLARGETTRRLEAPKGPKDFDTLFDDFDWVAVVHADGNGVGSIFRKFDDADQLRRFSMRLEEVTEDSLCEAFEVLRDRNDPKRLRGLPLVLGGDDFTLLCDGRRALPFAESYLNAFERNTNWDSVDRVAPDLRSAHEDFVLVANGGLAACAGVAITKRHFPFSSSYELAEQLTREAKDAVKRRYAKSALDFHILFDSTFADLDSIRARLQVRGAGLTRKPYVVSKPDVSSNPEWTAAHDLGLLAQRTGAIRAGTQEGGGLPNSQLHELREGLQLGEKGAEARAILIRHRYPDLDKLLEDAGSVEGRKLFHPMLHDTAFLDALESAPFWAESAEE